MHCRNLNKFMFKNKYFKSFSTDSSKCEQLYCCFKDNDNGYVSSLKFVPKQNFPKISAESYHSSVQQANISERIHSLQNMQTSNDSKLLEYRVENLMQIGKPSHLNFSTSSKSFNNNYLDAIAHHSKELLYDQSKSVVQRTPNPSGVVRIWQNIPVVDEPWNDRSYRHQFIEQLDIKSQLMEVKKESNYGLTTVYPKEKRTVVAITTRDAADADGVYYVKSEDQKLDSK